MTEQDKKLFELLRAGQTGGMLSDYLSRTLADLCDLRQVQFPAGSKEYEIDTAARILAAKFVQKHVIDQINLANELKTTDNNQYT